MITKQPSVLFAAALVTAILALAGCHGGTTGTGSSGYVPMSQQMQSPGRAANADLSDATNASVGAVLSSCGRAIKITLAGIVNCKFRQKGYAGKFTVANHLNGIASVSPTKGTKSTTFTVTGLVAGGGNFVVKGGNHKTLKVTVKVNA